MKKEKDYGYYSFQEIADILGCSRQMVKKYEARALRKMKQYILKRRIKDPTFMTIENFKTIFKGF